MSVDEYSSTNFNTYTQTQPNATSNNEASEFSKTNFYVAGKFTPQIQQLPDDHPKMAQSVGLVNPVNTVSHAIGIQPQTSAMVQGQAPPSGYQLQVEDRNLQHLNDDSSFFLGGESGQIEMKTSEPLRMQATSTPQFIPREVSPEPMLSPIESVFHESTSFMIDNIREEKSQITQSELLVTPDGMHQTAYKLNKEHLGIVEIFNETDGLQKLSRIQMQTSNFSNIKEMMKTSMCAAKEPEVESVQIQVLEPPPKMPGKPAWKQPDATEGPVYGIGLSHPSIENDFRSDKKLFRLQSRFASHGEYNSKKDVNFIKSLIQEQTERGRFMGTDALMSAYGDRDDKVRVARQAEKIQGYQEILQRKIADLNKEAEMEKLKGQRKTWKREGRLTAEQKVEVQKTIEMLDEILAKKELEQAEEEDEESLEAITTDEDSVTSSDSDEEPKQKKPREAELPLKRRMTNLVNPRFVTGITVARRNSIVIQNKKRLKEF